MRVLRFSSTHFRNLRHEPIDLVPGVNLFIGANGHGKTNILEAIQFFKFGRSFRTQRDGDLICFDEPFCRAEIACEFTGEERSTFAASIERSGPKRIKIDGEEIGKYAELVGRYPCVLFGPHDLDLVSGYPAERRKYLDMVGSMTERRYLDGLRAYRRVLTQRNAALKAGDFKTALGAWSEALLEHGCALVAQRAELVGAIDSAMKPHLAYLSIPYPIELSYESELLSGRPEEVSCAEHFAAKLSAAESEELRRRTTMVGPHHDDIRILAEGKDLRRYGSQGQRRLAAVLLRLAELSYVEGKLNEPCVLLLDDLFSEFDEGVSGKLKQVLGTERQIFVTSPVKLDWNSTAEVGTFAVANGCVG